MKNHNFKTNCIINEQIFDSYMSCSKCKKEFEFKNLEKWGNLYACKDCIDDVKTWAQEINIFGGEK